MVMESTGDIGFDLRPFFQGHLWLWRSNLYKSCYISFIIARRDAIMYYQHMGNHIVKESIGDIGFDLRLFFQGHLWLWRWDLYKSCYISFIIACRDAICITKAYIEMNKCDMWLPNMYPDTNMYIHMWY